MSTSRVALLMVVAAVIFALAYFNGAFYYDWDGCRVHHMRIGASSGKSASLCRAEGYGAFDEIYTKYYEREGKAHPSDYSRQ